MKSSKSNTVKCTKKVERNTLLLFLDITLHSFNGVNTIISICRLSDFVVCAYMWYTTPHNKSQSYPCPNKCSSDLRKQEMRKKEKAKTMTEKCGLAFEGNSSKHSQCQLFIMQSRILH